MKLKAQAKDLVVLVADKNMEQIMHSLLKRTAALGIRHITYDLFVHPSAIRVVANGHSYCYGRFVDSMNMQRH